MSAPLDTLAARYWEASQALRGRNDVSRATAAGFLASQAERGFERMWAALEKGDYETAAVEALDSKWARQVGARAERIAETIGSGGDAG